MVTSKRMRMKPKIASEITLWAEDSSERIFPLKKFLIQAKRPGSNQKRIMRKMIVRFETREKLWTKRNWNLWIEVLRRKLKSIDLGKIEINNKRISMRPTKGLFKWSKHYSRNNNLNRKKNENEMNLNGQHSLIQIIWKFRMVKRIWTILQLEQMILRWYESSLERLLSLRRCNWGIRKGFKTETRRRFLKMLHQKLKLKVEEKEEIEVRPLLQWSNRGNLALYLA